MRKIIHIDMDAFYASVEQRDFPELKGKPVAVGGSKERGVVAAASYEARVFGVRSAMSSLQAYKKCPDIIFVKPRFEVYKEVSGQIRAIFAEYTDLIEPLALDEAYLDVTQNKKSMPFAMEVANEIRDKIFKQTGLTASAGISYNKFLAKSATEVNKPNGSFVITPKKAQQFIDQLLIEKFFGVGKVTASKMKAHGIFNGYDLRTKSFEQLQMWFGKAGEYYFNVARGVDNRPVNPNRIRKSVGAERTFSIDLISLSQLKDRLVNVLYDVNKRMANAHLKGRTITLKAKYSDFTQVTRSKTFSDFMTEEDQLMAVDELIVQFPEIEKGIRLLGIQVSNFELPVDDVQLGQLEIDFD